MLDTYILLLKQHLQRMNVWLKMAESRVKQEGEIGPGYDDVKKQLEDHQVGLNPIPVWGKGKNLHSYPMQGNALYCIALFRTKNWIEL